MNLQDGGEKLWSIRSTDFRWGVLGNSTFASVSLFQTIGILAVVLMFEEVRVGCVREDVGEGWM
jgi:hypothetical protein